MLLYYINILVLLSDNRIRRTCQGEQILKIVILTMIKHYVLFLIMERLQKDADACGFHTRLLQSAFKHYGNRTVVVLERGGQNCRMQKIM